MSDTPDKKPLLVVLDLDECLIHSRGYDPSQTYDFIIPRDVDDSEPLYGTMIRPGVDEFLDFLFDNDAFDVGVWTSATDDYAAVVVDKVFGPERQPSFVFSRERCVKTWDYRGNVYSSGRPEQLLIKDLKKVKKHTGYDYDRMVAIDDNPVYYLRQYSNLVTVPEYLAKPEKAVFPHLMSYLEKLATLDDVRPAEKRGWLSKYRTGDHLHKGLSPYQP